MKLINLMGQRFGRLVVIKRVENRGRKVCWCCLCDCGKETVVTSTNLITGHSKSCGCMRSDVLIQRNTDVLSIHKGTGTRLFKIWMGMRERCRKKDSIYYKHYASRGITVCTEWQNSFESFRDWALANGYDDSLSIDRIDVNGNYCPDNCRWATPKEQARNKRTNRYFQGKTLPEWADIVGIPYTVISSRIYLSKWTFERAITEPVHKRGRCQHGYSKD